MEFYTSPHGKINLRLNGYNFYRHKKSRGTSFRWSCTASKCKAHLIIDDQLQVLKTTLRHKHQPPPKYKTNFDDETNELQKEDKRKKNGKQTEEKKTEDRNAEEKKEERLLSKERKAEEKKVEENKTEIINIKDNEDNDDDEVIVMNSDVHIIDD